MTGLARWRFPTTRTGSPPAWRERQRGLADLGIAEDAPSAGALRSTMSPARVSTRRSSAARRAGGRGPSPTWQDSRARSRPSARRPSRSSRTDAPSRGRYLLALASIGPRCGGGMRLTPGPSLDDGWLDLLMLEPLTLTGALGRLPRLFDGRLAGDPAFHVVALPHCDDQPPTRPAASNSTASSSAPRPVSYDDTARRPERAGLSSAARLAPGIAASERLSSGGASEPESRARRA